MDSYYEEINKKWNFTLMKSIFLIHGKNNLCIGQFNLLFIQILILLKKLVN